MTSGGPEPGQGSGPGFHRQDHVIVVVMLAGVFLASYLLPLVGGTGVRICPFYLLTGHPCPGCGMGRSFCAVTQGDLWEALRYHLLGPFVYLMFLVILIRYSVELYLGRRLVPPPWLRRLTNGVLWIAVVATMVAWFVRLWGWWPLPPD